MINTTKLAGLALALTVSIATAGGEGWMTDFAAAKKKAAAEKKDLLVDFTGSDWCGWCIKLKDEVFKHDAFNKGVADKYILVEIDYPKDSSKMSDATKKQNGELKDTYKIQGYPTIMLMDAQGRPFAQTGYQKGGPENYLTHLETLQAQKTKRDKDLAAADKLSGEEKAKALVSVLKELPEDQLTHYSAITDEITKLDPKDTSGFVKAQKLKDARKKLESDIGAAMQSGKGDTAPALIDQFIKDNQLEGKEKQKMLETKLQIEAGNAARAGDTDKALSLVDSYISENKTEGEDKQNLLGLKMGILINTKKFDDAAKVIDTIIAVDPESKTGKFAEEFKPRLAKMKEAAANPKKANPAHGQPGHVHGNGE
jgi:thioredoxin-related protein